MIRVEVRCLPSGRSPRSGCLVIDLHDLLISNAVAPPRPPLRFFEGMQTSPYHVTDRASQIGICNIQLQEILAAYATVGETRAQTFFVLGGMGRHATDEQQSTLLAPERSLVQLPIRFALGRTTISKHSPRSPSSRLSLTADIPLVNIILGKRTLDGLQYWADDVTQFIECSLSYADDATETLPSQNANLIGSRFFAKKSRNLASQSSEDSEIDFSVQQSRTNAGEVAVKINVTEGNAYRKASVRFCLMYIRSFTSSFIAS